MARVLIAWVATVLLILAGLFWLGLQPASTSGIHSRSNNVDAFGGFLSAISAMGTDDQSLLVTRVHAIPSGTSCSVPAHIELVFAPGSGVSIESGATVEFWGPVVAGSYQVFYGSGHSEFGSETMEPYWLEAWIGGNTEVGRSRRPGAGYAMDVRGTIRADGLSGALPTSDLSGTMTNSQLPDPITNSLETTGIAAGMVRTIEVDTAVSTEVRELSGVSGQYITGASNAARSMLSGVSVRLRSPSGGESAVFYLADDTAQTGNTISALFEAGDTIICEDDLIAGTSKFVLSGATDACGLTVVATGVSTWLVRQYGYPSIDWE